MSPRIIRTRLPRAGTHTSITVDPDGVPRIACRLTVSSAAEQPSRRGRGGVLDQEDLGGSMEPVDSFGDSLACSDLDGDGHDDAVIGAPAEDIGVLSETGVVTVVHGGLFGDGFEDGGSDRWSGIVP